jgi:hypothetical protein
MRKRRAERYHQFEVFHVFPLLISSTFASQASSVGALM